MTIQIHQNWPVAIPAPPDGITIRKETPANDPAQPVHRLNRLNSGESDSRRPILEKGSVIDIYV